MARPRSLLVVEDDKAVAESLTRVLTSEDYSVLNASSCDEALLEFSRNDIDIVLLDLTLGAEDGWNVLHALRSLQPDLPIIVTSARASELDPHSSRTATGVLEKPFDVPKLLDLLEETTEKAQAPQGVNQNHRGFIQAGCALLAFFLAPMLANAVVVRPQITAINVQNGNVIVRWQGGGTNQLQSAPTPNGPWQDVDIPTTGFSGTNVMTQPSAFYRDMTIVNNTAAASDYAPPAAPSGFQATSAGCNQVNLSWNPAADPSPSSGIKGYDIYRNGIFLKQVTNSPTTDTGLIASSNYTYSILAIDNAGRVSPKADSAATPTCGVQTLNGSYQIYANSVVGDHHGNSIVAGQFSGTLDPGDGISRSSTGGSG